MTTISKQSPVALPPVDARIGALGHELAKAFATLLAALPGAPLRPAELARTLGVDVMLSSRLLKATQAGDALAVAHLMPGPEPLRRVIKAAQRLKVDQPLVDEAAARVDQFEQLIQTEAGDRGALDAMISAYLPEAREKFETATKQAAFRVMSQLKGLATEASLSAFILHPSADNPRAVDAATVTGTFGLRRMQPGARIGFSTHSAEEGSVLTLDRKPFGGPDTTLIPEFCSDPPPRFEMHRSGDTVSYWVAGDEVGLTSSVDIVLGEYEPAAMRRYFEPGGQGMTGLIVIPDTPSKRKTIDLFIHRDLYADAFPQLAVYDTVPRGQVLRFNDPLREPDRIRFEETVRPIGSVAGARLSHIPRYLEMIEHTCGKLGWDPGAFRCFRLDITYPVYGAQYMLGLALPQAPEGA